MAVPQVLVFRTQLNIRCPFIFCLHNVRKSSSVAAVAVEPVKVLKNRSYNASDGKGKILMIKFQFLWFLFELYAVNWKFGAVIFHWNRWWGCTKMEEIEFRRTWNKYINDCETYEVGFEWAKEKGYVFKMIIWLSIAMLVLEVFQVYLFLLGFYCVLVDV